MKKKRKWEKQTRKNGKLKIEEKYKKKEGKLKMEEIITIKK